MYEFQLTLLDEYEYVLAFYKIYLIYNNDWILVLQ